VIEFGDLDDSGPGMPTRKGLHDRGRHVAIEAADEVVMIVKTRASLAERVTAALRADHSYETPAILVLPISGGNQSFIDWILAETEH